jgi:hypothetical protein
LPAPALDTIATFLMDSRRAVSIVRPPCEVWVYAIRFLMFIEPVF